jgi:hypothetical protein
MGPVPRSGAAVTTVISITPDLDWLRPPNWRPFLRGQGRLETTDSGLRLVDEAASAQQYTNAQIDDYQGRARRDFLWRPPLTLTVRARFSHPAATPGVPPGAATLHGTAGFGFWNDPFLMTGWRLPALPRALWFFYASPPSDMKLDLRTPGWGWKAACIDAASWPVRLLLPLAPLAVPLMRSPVLYPRLWPVAQRLLHVCEAPVAAPMVAWHTYQIHWEPDRVAFTVDAQPILDCPVAIHGPFGLVIWIDNQYLVATPQGRFRYGLLDSSGPQWLELATVQVARGLAW